jgi:hypothetical protein
MKILKLSPLIIVCLGMGYFCGLKKATSSNQDSITVIGNQTSSAKKFKSKKNVNVKGLGKVDALNAAVEKMDLPTVKRKFVELTKNGKVNPVNEADNLLFMALVGRWAKLDAKDLLKYAIQQKNQIAYLLFSSAFQQLAENDLDGALREFKKLDSQQKTLVSRTLVLALTKSDPERAMKFYLEQGDLNDQYTYGGSPIDEIIAALISKNPLKIADFILTIKASGQRQSMIGSFVTQWYRINPESTMKWIETLSVKEDKQAAMDKVMSCLATMNSEKGFFYLEGVQSGSKKDQLIQSLFSQVALNDFDKAQQLLVKLINPADRMMAINGILGGGCQMNREKLMKLATILSPHEASVIYNGMFNYGFPGSDQMNESLVNQLPEGLLKEKMKSQLLSSICYKDPEKALKMFDELSPAATNQSGVVYQLASQLAGINPEKALNWANNLKNPNLKKQAISSIYQKIASDDPENVLTRVKAIQNPVLRDEILQSILKMVAAQNPQKALAYVETLPLDQKINSWSQIAQQQSQNNPAEARRIIELMAKNMTAEQWQSNGSYAVSRIVSDMSEYDFPGVMKWVSTLPQGSAQEQGYASMVETLVRYTPKEAETFLQKMPSSKNRDKATVSFVGSVAQSDPQKAFQWSLSIQNKEDRISAISQTINAWKELDQRDQAMNAITSSRALTTEEAEQFRSMLK